MPSKYSIHDKEIKAIIEASNSELTNTHIAKIILKTNKNQQQDKEIDHLKTYIRRHRKRILDLHEGIANACNNTDVAITSAKNIWIKTKATETSPGVSAFIVNPDFIAPENAEKEIDFLSIFQGKVTPIQIIPKCVKKGIFDRVVYTNIMAMDMFIVFY